MRGTGGLRPAGARGQHGAAGWSEPGGVGVGRRGVRGVRGLSESPSPSPSLTCAGTSRPEVRSPASHPGLSLRVFYSRRGRGSF